MTSATVEGRLPQRTAVRGVTFPRVLRSEWTKLWWLRSTRWSLLAAVIGMAGLGALVAVFQMNRWPHMDPRERAHFNSIDAGVGGYHLAQLAIAVLGVLVISGEYSTGMIRSSFMAVPRRLPVLWAKLTTYGFVTFVLMLASSFMTVVVAKTAGVFVRFPVLDRLELSLAVGRGAIRFRRLCLCGL